MSTTKKKASGSELIAAERQRQIDKEGWVPSHDDEHADSELAIAAICYAAPRPIYMQNGYLCFRDPWPWEQHWDKRPRTNGGRVKTSDQLTPRQRIRQLVKAGALIAAEIDRLQRKSQ